MPAMAKIQRGYRCSTCGWESGVYEGRCRQCSEWNVLEPFMRTPVAGAAATRAAVDVLAVPTFLLSEVPEDDSPRLISGIPEFDRVLGGGLVPGSLVLLGGEPGIGKSTLALQAAARLASPTCAVAYICGEESPRQVRMRATRLGVTAANIHLIASTGLEAALATAESLRAGVVIVDSIQMITVEGLESRSGGPAQLAEAGARLVTWAKSTGIATIMTGHVTKTGEIAGPRLLEHLVDAVLYFEGAESGALRILRAVKNRFGATDEVGVFEMTGEGLRSIENASAAFLDAIDQDASGCAVTAVMEGSRPIALEVQALAVNSQLPAPRRIASGLDASRLHLLLAVSARRAGINAGQMDVVATVSGGLKLRDAGADLAILCALASAIKDRPIERGTAFLGEVALSGVIRPSQQGHRRLIELSRMGFQRCIAAPGTPQVDGIQLIPVRTVREAVNAALVPN